MKRIIILLIIIFVSSAYGQIDPRTEQAIADSIDRLEIKVDLNVDSLTAYDLRIIINADSITAHGLLIDTRIDTAVAQRTDIDANTTAIASVTSAQGETIVDSIAAYIRPFSASIPSPQASENVGLFYSARGMTVSQFIAVLETAEAGGESVTLDIVWGASIATASFGLFGGGTTVTSITTGDISTSFTSNSIPANNWVWVNVVSVTGTVTNLLISVEYSE